MTNYNTLRDADEIGCYGLVSGFARNLYTHELFSAETCTAEDGPFYCTSCFTDAVVRKCTEKKDHFAHKARLSPVAEGGEGDLHSKCKSEICNALVSLVPDGKWETERTIEANKRLGTPGLRPDISGYIDGRLVAIEVQASVLSISKIVKKTEAYTKWKINTLWIVPLTEELGSLPYRPRLYERYLHSMYFGRIYYWTLGSGLVLNAVHLGIAGRHVEYREWYEDGDFKTGGDYFKPYKIIKRPVYGDRVSIFNDFRSDLRPEFTPGNLRKSVPRSYIWRDNLLEWWDFSEESKYTEGYFEEAYFDIRLPVSSCQQELQGLTFHPFDSQVEAQWAVFFGAIGIEFEYKKEIFQLESGSFIPDFWLPQVNMWAEVTPSTFPETVYLQCQLLSNTTGRRCLLLEGPPAFKSYWGLAPEDEECCFPDVDYFLTSEYLHSEHRFYCDTGFWGEDLSTDQEIFGDDYVAAVKESNNALKRWRGRFS